MAHHNSSILFRAQCSHQHVTQKNHTLGAAAAAAEAPESTSTIQAICLASILVTTSVAVM
eukprot:16182-Heterococcus_DN1.PRE.1